MRNDYSYRNLSRFEFKFELKFKEFLWVEIEEKSLEILELWISIKFDQQAPCHTLL
jgi:hypothetical protein